MSSSPCVAHRMPVDWYETESPTSSRYEPGKSHLWNRHYANYRAQRRQKENQRTLILSLIKDAPRSLEDVCASAKERSLEERFHVQAAKWKLETQHLSSPLQRMMHPSYQAILGMGAERKREIISLMLHDLQENHGDWLLALSFLTQENPIDQKDAGKTDKLAKAWVTWGKKQGLL
jgi:hypothetical protein